MTTYAVTDPYTGHRHATYPSATDAEIEEALAAAEHAYRSWARHAPPAERAARLRDVATLLRERAEDLGAIQRHENGKVADGGEAQYGAGLAEYFADHAEELAQDLSIDHQGEGSAFVRRTPLGPLLCVLPWNAPIHLCLRFVAANLAVGNTVVLKPDPHVPETAAALQQVFDDAGLAGAVVTVRATNEQVESMIADARIVGVSVTGSARAGAAIAEIAGRHLTKVALELGGSDPFVVLSADDLDEVVETAYWNRMILTGQACVCAKRFIVIDGLYEAFVAKLAARMDQAPVGDPAEDGVEVGALCSLEAAQRVEARVQAAVAQGATLVTGGTRDGATITPGVLAGVEPGNDVYGTEIFGPVAMVHRVVDEAQAIAVANDTPYGLGSFVFSTDHDQAMRVADALEAGMVRINAGLVMAPALPFGGVKASGTGREEGLMAADEFVNMKLIYSAD